ncbi:uncharacterized protein [Leptinotarsa decemlineata]|uniref:uncharacterized protein n=1 Tax=Leptinotarsa decemlineata TaxID=7539 RepID=UPI003D304472
MSSSQNPITPSPTRSTGNQHTNRYVNANSHHHPAQTNSVLNYLIHRSINLTDHHNKPQELAQLKTPLLQNGFTDHQIDRSIRRQQTSSSSPKDPKGNNVLHKAFLPYIKGLTDKIGQILKKQDIKTIITANNQISTFLRSPKDKIINESQGIHETPCSDCDRTYVGQTNRRVPSRVYEHQLAVRKSDPSSSLSKHYQKTGHNIDFANTKTIASAKTLQTRIIREAIEIEKRTFCLNKRDDGQRLLTA